MTPNTPNNLEAGLTPSELLEKDDAEQKEVNLQAYETKTLNTHSRREFLKYLAVLGVSTLACKSLAPPEEEYELQHLRGLVRIPEIRANIPRRLNSLPETGTIEQFITDPQTIMRFRPERHQPNEYAYRLYHGSLHVHTYAKGFSLKTGGEYSVGRLTYFQHNNEPYFATSKHIAEDIVQAGEVYIGCNPQKYALVRDLRFEPVVGEDIDINYPSYLHFAKVPKKLGDKLTPTLLQMADINHIRSLLEFTVEDRDRISAEISSNPHLYHAKMMHPPTGSYELFTYEGFNPRTGDFQYRSNNPIASKGMSGAPLLAVSNNFDPTNRIIGCFSAVPRREAPEPDIYSVYEEAYRTIFVEAH